MLSRKRKQRGFSLFEALLVMAVGAIAIVTVVTLADNAWDKAEYTRLSASVPAVVVDLGTWLTRYHRADCDGDGANDAYTVNLGADPGALGDTKYTLNPPADDDDRPCLLMWRQLGRIFEFNGTLATPDTMAISDMEVGIAMTPVATTLAAGGMATFVGEGAGTPSPPVTACADSLNRFALAVPVRSMEVCDDLALLIEDHRRVETAFCHEYQEAPAAVDGDAVMGICFE